MDGMVATGAGGALLRDVYAASQPWYPERAELYQAHVAHNILSNSAYDVTRNVRFYPLIGLNLEEGVYEAMAIKVARAMLQLPSPTSLARLGQESGIAAIWAVQAGWETEESLPEGVRQAGRNPRPYALGGERGIPWVLSPDPFNPAANAPAALWINYTAPPGRFPSISYVDALNRRTPPGYFKDKAVMVGVDRIFTYAVPTSLAQRPPAAKIVAHAVHTIVEGRFMMPMGSGQALAGVWLLAMAGAVAVALLRPAPSVILVVAVLVFYLGYATALYRSGTFPDLILAPAAFAASALLVGAYRYSREEIARRRIGDMFGRYVPRAVVSELMEKSVDEALALGQVNREITVLFADIRGFTTFSERFSAEEVLTRLNALLEVMVGCAFRYDGTVDTCCLKTKRYPRGIGASILRVTRDRWITPSS